MRDIRPNIYSVLIGLSVGMFMFVLFAVGEWLLIAALRPSYEGEGVFHLIALAVVLLALISVGALVVGVLVGVLSYRRMMRARITS
jgi:cation transporter-like permease